MSLRRFAAAIGVGAAILAPAQAMAQAKPQVSARASASQVEVGQPFSIELRFTVGRGGTVSEPDLRLPANLQSFGRSISQFSSGATQGVTITWQVVAQKLGHYAIPGPSLTFDGKRFSTSPIPIEVVASTGKPHPQPGLGNPFNNPFLTPGRGPQFPWLFGDEEPDDEPDGREAPDLNLPSGPDNWIFLRAVADKKAAVIGEQVTISFYIYHKPDYRQSAVREAPLADFRRVPLLTNPGAEPELKAKVGKEWFHVRLLDKVAAFPLRAGELHTGSMWTRLIAARLGAYNERETDDLTITVTEPPQKGRPPGYRVGDVGQFSLTAIVQPRKIDQGSGAAVTLRLAGSGNFPESLRVPERTGVEWLDPEKKEQIGPQNGVISGSRTFAYVVRVKDSGKVDLGSVELPYWDPATKKYDMTRVDLGSLEVTPTIPKIDPSASAAPVGPSAADPFTALGGPRMALGAFVAPRAPLWGEGKTLWLLLGAPPLLVGLSFVGAGALGRRRARRAERKESPATLAAQALRDAEEAEAKGDQKALAAAVERAVHLSIEAATTLKSRGVLLADLPGELGERGVPEALASEVQATLAECETIRFQPAASGGDKLSDRARSLLRELSSIKAP